MSEGSNDNNSQQSAALPLSKELLELCRSESLSEEGLRELIQRQGLTTHNNPLSDYTFFLAACRNERFTDGIIQCLLEYFPDAANATNKNGWSPLLFACCNKNVTLNIIERLIDAHPDSISSETIKGDIPLHFICGNEKVDETVSMQILNFLLEKYPKAVRLGDNAGRLPIHWASGFRSPEFCRVLIEAYPGSERITTTNGILPLHRACGKNSLATVEYLHGLSTDTIGHVATGGLCPIHAAIFGIKRRKNPAAAVGIVKFLLNCDPNQKLKRLNGKSLLQFARGQQYNDSNIEAGIEMIKIVYGAQPVSSDGWSPLYYACSHKSVTLNIIQRLIEEAPDSVRSVNNDGWMALHILCNHKHRDEVRSMRIMRFLIEKYPEVVRHADNHGRLPIHIAACTRSSEFCRVLIEAYPGSERITTNNGSLPLHFACLTGSLATVEYLYGQYPEAINLPRTTAGGLYPIHDAILGITQRENPADALEIAQFLLKCDPNQKLVQFQGMSLLDYACGKWYNASNIEVGIKMMKILFDAHPEAITSANNKGHMPLHTLCCTSKVDKSAAIETLKFLLQKHSEAVSHADNEGFLPIHHAARWRSPEFCRVLIDAYPGSERITTNNGGLPLHRACGKNSLATVEYLYRQYTDAINHASEQGHYPIHTAIQSIKHRENPAAAVEIVQFLLDCDPDQKLKLFQGASLLRVACRGSYNDSNIEAAVQTIQILFDALPEQIEDNRIATDIQRYHQRVQAFINSELVYTRQANDHRLMHTLDDNGRLPLHTSLQSNVRLGSIKLLIKGNPSALRTFDNNLAMPLHIACQHHDSASLIQYLLSLSAKILDAVDRQGNTALHYACRGAKYNTIAMLLKKYDAASVATRNAHGKLPINLLWESNAVEDRESIEYTESVFRLLKAYPETLMNMIEHQPALGSCPGLAGKKRKFGNEE